MKQTIKEFLKTLPEEAKITQDDIELVLLFLEGVLSYQDVARANGLKSTGGAPAWVFKVLKLALAKGAISIKANFNRTYETK